jgi:phenylacetate-CoA ligase
MLELPPIEQRYLEPVETLPRAQLLALQQERLLQMVAYAYERSEFVRGKWQAAGLHPSDIRSTSDFVQTAPLVDKEALRAYRDAHGDPFCGMLCIDPGDVSFMGSSSGTTGDPTLFSYRWGADGNLPAAPGLPQDGPSAYWGGTLRDWWEMGIRPGDYAVYFGLRLRGPMFRLLQTLGVTPVMLGYGPDDLYQFIDLSRRYRPTLLYAMSSFLGARLVDLEREMGIDMADVVASYKAILVAGEPIGPRMRETFERWGLAGKLYTQTSYADIGHAHDCREHDGCHAWEDIGLPEIIDPATARPIDGDGRGELVVTSLVNPVDPLIRFRSGDVVDLKRGACGCGRTHSRFDFVGRAADEAIIAGRSILPMDIWGAIEDVPETAHALFQIIRPQRELQTLKIRVGYAGRPKLDDLARRVADSVEAAIGVLPTIELVPNEIIIAGGSRHKIARTVKR